jgi:hypothetical protein
LFIPEPMAAPTLSGAHDSVGERLPGNGPPGWPTTGSVPVAG